MKNKIFSKGLYVEGLRQNRLIGILFTVINTVIAVMIPLLTVLEESSYDYYRTPTPVHFFSPTNILFVLVFAVFTPILTEHLFSFLNKRNTSDFYHSIPHTRVCLFISYALSIVTWIAIAIAVQTAASLIVFAIFPQYFALMYSTVLPTVLSIFAASILVEATFLIGMALTGTVFNNMIISLLILLLPRFIMYFMNIVITDTLPQILEGRLFPLFANKYNIVTSMAFGWIDLSFSYSELFASVPAIIYTVVLALIYFVIGCQFFHKRKSETAGSSASSPRMQAFFRILVCMTICIIPAMLIFAELVSDRYLDVSLVIVLYVLALIAFFVYEAITTKKWKNLLRAIPSLGIVLLLNIAVIAGMFGIYYSQLNYTPDEKDVKSFSFVPENSPYGNDYSFTDYIELKKENIRITDPKLIKYVTDALEFDVETYKKNKADYFNYFYADEIPEKHPNAQRYERISVSFNSGLAKKYRSFFIPVEQYDEILDSLKNNPDVKDLYMNLPNALNGTVEINYMYNKLKLTAEEGNKIYAMMREEIRQCEYDKWFESCNTAMFSAFELYFSVEEHGTSCKIRVYPDEETQPKTCKMINDAYLKHEIEDLKLFEELTTCKDTRTDISLNAEFGVVNKGFYFNGFASLSLYFTLDEKDFKDEDYDTIKWILNNAVIERCPEVGDILLTLYVYSWDPETSKNTSCIIQLPVDKEKMLEIEGLRIEYEKYLKYNEENIDWESEPESVETAA